MTFRQARVFGFGFTAVAILFLALVPGSLGEVIENDVLRHVLAFATLALMARAVWPRAHGLMVWTALSLFGGAIEVLQGWMALGREADWLDWLNDMATAGCALVAASLVLALIRTPSPGKRERHAVA